MKKIMLIHLTILICLWSLPQGKLGAESLIVIYPRSESELDRRYDYHWAVLAAALEATREEGEYTLRPADMVMSENRVFEELKTGSGKITVIRDNCSKTMEESLLPIRIPLLKGALGWRVFLIREDLQPKLSEVEDLEDLKAFTIGAGKGWGNIPLLEEAGFTLCSATDYEGLFRMLMAGRFDLYDRGIIEAPTELAVRKGTFPRMSIEENLLLLYPILDYFYVNKEDTALASRIERGLLSIIEDGTMNRLFDGYYGTSLDSLHLDRRKVFSIGNSDLGRLPFPDRPEFWLEDYLEKKRAGAF